MAIRRGLVVSLLVLVALLYFAGFLSPHPAHAAWADSAAHPIPKLMADAEAHFRALITRQSRSLDAAVAEYRRRYARDPPRGFDEWFAFAQEHDVKIIDEYDSMMSDLEPFWVLSGEEIRRRAQQVGHLPSIDLVRLENGKTTTLNIPKAFKDSEVNARAKGFRVMIEKFQAKLPDMDFPINANAEGRILIPWEHKMYPNMSKLDSSGGIESMLDGEFIPDWRGKGNVWEEYRRTCPPSSQARRLFGSVRAQPGSSQRPLSYLARRSSGSSLNDSTGNTAAAATAGTSTATPLPSDPAEQDSDFAFATRPDDTYDYCQNPSSRFLQGHFFSDWRTIPVLYPVFSPGKPSGYGDLVIPSHYYHASSKRYTYGWDPVRMVVKDVDDAEVPWEEKTERVYWRGATTGGGSSPPGFLTSYQRPRFIDMAAGQTNATRTVVFEDPPGSARYVTATVPLAELNDDIMDVAFTKAVGCTRFQPDGCEGFVRHYRFAEPVPMGELWRHKYLVDFDGMGYSARMMALLASDSAVVKATVYREFFSDWIQPWLHYIPLSQSYKEIYNIHAYFSGPSPSMLKAVNSTTSLAPHPRRPRANLEHEGDKRLRRIARAGRQWKHTIGRKVDMEAYVYRLCLEYARLWADDREAMSYKH